MQVDREALRKALEKAVSSAKRRFTQSVELIVNLRDVDTKRPENKFNELIEPVSYTHLTLPTN